MGHQISKQQNQQMSDDQQMTSSIETHTDPTTSANDLQVKINKNTRLFTSNGKKSKKHQQHQQQRTDVKSKIKTKSKSKASTTIKSTTENTVETVATSNQERNSTGSVVITIRLLKMESTRDFDMNSVGNELTEIDNYSNNNITNSSSSSSNRSSSNNNNNNNNQNIQAYGAGMPENSAQRQNFNFNMDQNNVSALTANAIYDNGINSVKKSNVKRILHGKATVCYNVPMNCTSQIEQQQQQQQQPQQLQQTAVLNNCLAHSFNEIRLNEPITATAIATPSSPTPPLIDQKSTKNAFIPSNLIGTVSPYPHHIPIANIIRSDCFSGIVDEHSALCQHAKKVCSSCGSNSGGSSSSIGSGGSGSNNVIKQNGASKESKELKSKKPNWGIKLNCTKLKGIKSLSSSLSSEPSSPSSPTTTVSDSDNINNTSTINENNATITTTVQGQQPTALLCTSGGNVIIVTTDQQQQWFASDEYSIDDCDKKAHLQRAIEIAENVEPASSGFISTSSLKSLHSMSSSNLPLLPGAVASVSNESNGRNIVSKTSVSSPHWTMVCSNNPSLRIIVPSAHLLPRTEDMARIHSQVDYIHCLVPDLMQITNCSFYWGKMDRYEAERLLDNKPEGTFLLRDSAQEDYLFSVSFRKYGRSLHARIEQFNHKFSFDCHDSSVYTSRTVTGLLEHYKDPGCVMFFEPALSIPLNRNFVFSLQQLCRATIVSHTTYDGINEICLPKKLKSYLKEYHYRQNVRVKRFDEPIYGTS